MRRKKRKRYSIFPLAVFLLISGAVLFCAGQSYISAQETVGAAEPKEKVNTFSQFSKTMSNTFGKNKSRTSNTTLVIVIALFGTVIVGTLVAYDRYNKSRRTKEGYYSTESLFRELCKMHHFDRTEQTILRKLAKVFQLTNPLEIFVEPRFLELALAERVVPYTQNQIRKIFLELFSTEDFSLEQTNDKPPSWFAWTVVKDNPDSEQLKRDSDVTIEAHSPTGESVKVRRWDPSLWEDVDRAVKGLSKVNKQNENDTEPNTKSGEIPSYSAPPLKTDVAEMETLVYHAPQPEPKRERREPIRDFAPQSDDVPPSSESIAPSGIDTSKRFYPPEPPSTGTTYKPQYPGTNNSVHQKESVDEHPYRNSVNVPPPNSGSQLMSSIINSVSDLNAEMNANSIRNHLSRFEPNGPSSLREMKPTQLPRDGMNPPKYISLDEIEVSPTEKSVATLAQPNVFVRPIDIKSDNIEKSHMTISEFMRRQIDTDENAI